MTRTRKRVAVGLTLVIALATTVLTVSPSTAGSCGTGYGFIPRQPVPNGPVLPAVDGDARYVFAPPSQTENEDGYLLVLTPGVPPGASVNTTNPGVSGHIHDNGEIVDWQLPPEYRPLHYINCKYIAPRGL